MNFKDQIKSLLQEAEVYRSHGLFVESMKKYKETAELIKKNDRLKNRQKLILSISKKLRSLKDDADRFEQIEMSAKMSDKEKDLVKEFFFNARSVVRNTEGPYLVILGHID